MTCYRKGGCGINYPHCKEDCYWYKEEPHMGAHIPYCQNKGGNFIEPKDCENCEHYHSKYKKTNANHIRSMTDEELAEFLTEYHCVYKAPHCMETNCTQCWLNWLKKEASNDNP